MLAVSAGAVEGRHIQNVLAELSRKATIRIYSDSSSARAVDMQPRTPIPYGDSPFVVQAIIAMDPPWYGTNAEFELDEEAMRKSMEKEHASTARSAVFEEMGAPGACTITSGWVFVDRREQCVKARSVAQEYKRGGEVHSTTFAATSMLIEQGW